MSSRGAALIRTLRPHQWVKNMFVAAALVFARHLDGLAVRRRARRLAVLAFCSLSGAVYASTTCATSSRIAQHPTKRHRPIAAGALSRARRADLGRHRSRSIALAGCLAAVAAARGDRGALPRRRTSPTASSSSTSRSSTSLLIASGFLLARARRRRRDRRAGLAAGCCCAPRLLALFFGLGKRAHELAWAERSGKATHHTRAALAGYRMPGRARAMLVLAVADLRGLRRVHDRRRARSTLFGTDRLVYTAPFVALGIAALPVPRAVVAQGRAADRGDAEGSVVPARSRRSRRPRSCTSSTANGQQLA